MVFSDMLTALTDAAVNTATQQGGGLCDMAVSTGGCGNETVARICDSGEGSGGLLIPSFAGDGTVAAVVYCILLLYCFLGVGIIADIFMSAIEEVTSQKSTKTGPDGHETTAPIWNGTVANLTLMALGSSAPEILLNVIGIFPTFQASALGPSTIVGSAAFNLLVIIAVCIVAIPEGGVRRIKYLGVFGITAFFSVFAYVWLLIILLVTTPNQVTVFEGVMTFVFFIILIVLAYLMDINSATDPVRSKNTTDEELAEMEQFVRDKYGKNRFLTEEETKLLVIYTFPPVYSRAVHRSNAIKAATGGRKRGLADEDKEKAEALVKKLMSEQVQLEPVPKGMASIQFQQLVWSFVESCGEAVIKVNAKGPISEACVVKYATRAGTATLGEDFVEAKGTLTFTDADRMGEIRVPIKTSAEKEVTEYFYIDLEMASGPAVIQQKTATITIIDEGKVEASDGDAVRGEIRFREEKIYVAGATGATEDIPLNIDVLRVRGAQGEVSCKWKTVGDTAVEGADFEANEGTITFGPLETEKTITVMIKPNTAGEGSEVFRIILSDITGGAAFDETTDGGEDEGICTVKIAGEKGGGFTGAVKKVFNVNWDRVAMGNATYMDNFKSAFYVNGGEESEDGEPFGIVDYVMHVLTLPWKLVFAIVPPPVYLNGWICFFFALAMIGLVTCIIGDLAELMGCAMGLADSITAITIVALGTSLPDTFASRTAAVMEATADNSIGNVTGSNSVNVFLGLGLPWMISAIVWASQTCGPDSAWATGYAQYLEGRDPNLNAVFVVPAGDLAFSVGVFSAFAIVAIALILIRRVAVGGELGGNPAIAYASSGFLVLLWITYIVLSILQTTVWNAQDSDC